MFSGSGSTGTTFGASSSGSTFGNPGSSFGKAPSLSLATNTNNNSNSSGQTFNFGSQNQSNPTSGGNSGGSLFGQPQQSQQGSFFGGSGNNSFGGSNLGNSTNAGNTQNPLFSNPTPVFSPQPNQQLGQSLFKKDSLFSVSSSDADVAKFKESIQGQSQQPTTNNQNNLYPVSPSINNTPSSTPAFPLRHSQSSITLGNGPGYRRSNTPSWATEKRFNPSTPSNLRHVSSFNTSDRGPMSVRKASLSPSQSPINSFGNSFSGVSKPSHAKKKNIIQEDPPPTRSIYDSDSSNMSLAHRPDSSSSNLLLDRRTSMSSNAGTPISSTPGRPVRTLDHSLSVVIFGFPSSVTPAVVAHFSRFGTISENVDSSSRFPIMSSPNKSLRAPPTPIQTGKNWLKITYDNPTSATRAINENGTLIAGQYVVGCIPVTSQNYKEFETASETSMHLGLQSPGESIGDYSVFDDTTVDFTDGNILPPSEHEGSEDHSTILSQQNGKSIGRTVSMPSLAGSKRVELKDGRTIFNKSGKQVRYSPSLFKISQEPDQDTKVIGKQAGGAPESDKRLQSGKQGWMSWTSKKAQELVFGWDDL